jgi:hypothetical protein
MIYLLKKEKVRVSDHSFAISTRQTALLLGLWKEGMFTGITASPMIST